ncbi:MAG: hypothetical protein Q8Q28_13360 [Pseudomonadota bacterium]|nr:hypothetical protein [Pseudomonadota bacterium]
MTATTLTATTLARNFSEYLNQVRYQGAEFDIRRGNEIIARLCPPRPSAGYPVERLAGLYAGLPTLADDADAFLEDLREAERHLAMERDAWES